MPNKEPTETKYILTRPETVTVQAHMVTPEGFTLATATTDVDPEAERYQNVAELMEIRKKVQTAWQTSARTQQQAVTDRLAVLLADLDARSKRWKDDSGRTLAWPNRSRRNRWRKTCLTVPACGRACGRRGRYKHGTASMVRNCGVPRVRGLPGMATENLMRKRVDTRGQSHLSA